MQAGGRYRFRRTSARRTADARCREEDPEGATLPIFRRVLPPLRRARTTKACPLCSGNPLGCVVRRDRGGGGIVAKGQEKPKKTNKPKLTTAEKQKKKKEKSTTSK
jgi:hypothetical protein